MQKHKRIYKRYKPIQVVKSKVIAPIVRGSTHSEEDKSPHDISYIIETRNWNIAIYMELGTIVHLLKPPRMHFDLW